MLFLFFCTPYSHRWRQAFVFLAKRDPILLIFLFPIHGNNLAMTPSPVTAHVTIWHICVTCIMGVSWWNRERLTIVASLGHYDDGISYRWEKRKKNIYVSASHSQKKKKTHNILHSPWYIALKWTHLLNRDVLRKVHSYL